MLLELDQKLDERIVRFLALHPGSSATEILKGISQPNEDFTIQGIYRQLNALMEGGVVFKTKTRFALNFNWVLDLVGFAHELEETYLQKSPIFPTKLSKNQKYNWKFSSLFRLNDLWINLILNLVNHSPSRTYLSWTPHAWYLLLQDYQEVRFWRALKEMGILPYKMMGGSTALDMEAARFWESAGIVYSTAKGPYHHERNTHYTVIGDAIITVTIDQATTEEIEDIYQSTSDVSLLDMKRVWLFFKRRADACLTLERNTEKALRFHEEFQEFFKQSVRLETLSS